MISLTIKIENLDELRESFAKAPQTMLRYLSQAVAASIFTIEKHSTDTNFQFKTPRALRTGYLEQSFAFGRKIEALRGSIGPTATYAPYVYFGTSRGIRPNPYMDRIVNASEREVNDHFNNAVQSAVREIANI
jgi:hypothetical protein